LEHIHSSVPVLPFKRAREEKGSANKKIFASDLKSFATGLNPTPLGEKKENLSDRVARLWIENTVVKELTFR
jgi:hypothetical protein